MELKDVIHFYQGCEVRYRHKVRSGLINLHENVATWTLGCVHYWPDNPEEELSVNVWNKGMIENAGLSQITPLLRPLSSMNREEIIHLFYLKGFDYREVATRTGIDDGFIQIEYLCAGERLSDYHVAPFFNPDQFAYLVKLGIDIFNLIPEGKAIDKTLK